MFCCFDNGDLETPEFFISKVVKARKAHRCYECSVTIAPKEHYHKITAKWGGDVETLKVCLECEALREELYYFNSMHDNCYCIGYGELMGAKDEAKDEGWSEDWVLTAPPPKRRK